jgi:beta-phosphoglucomutase family hydrolase
MRVPRAASKISAVIFDMDGLMFDTESLFHIAQAAIAAKRGKEFTYTIQAKMMGQKSLHAIEIMLDELGLSDDPSEILRERDVHYAELLKTRSEMMPGLLELLDFLEAHHLCTAIASGSQRAWINFLLERFNLRDRFEVIVSSDEVERGKPSPDIFLKAVERLGLPASSCLVLEDALNGIRAAKAAGCRAVAVPSKFTAHQDFAEADLIISGLADQKLQKILT